MLNSVIIDDITAIKTRNAAVEADKAWETSMTRRGLIMVITYILATCLMFFIGAPYPYLGALVPTFGYVLSTLSTLSTLSLKLLKKYWLKNIYIDK